MAAPSRYTTERAARIIAARRAGATLKASAAAGGVTYHALDDWRAKRPAFALALEEADSAHQIEVLEGLMPSLIGDRDPTTGEWRRDEHGKLIGLPNPDVLLRWLAQKWPEEFGRRRHEHTGADGGAIEHTDPEANRRALAAKLERLAERRGELAGNGAGAPAHREPETANGGQGRGGV